MRFLDIDPKNPNAFATCGATQLGTQRKITWLKQCVNHGVEHKIFQSPDTGKILGWAEYMPGEFAWRAVQAENYLVIHCILLARRAPKGQGIGTWLVQECIKDARKKKMNGVVALATKGYWCAGNRIYLKNGFEVVDEAPFFQLMVYQLKKGKAPSFGDWEQRLKKYRNGVYISYSKQCPFTKGNKAEDWRELLTSRFGLKVNVHEIENHEEAQANPCVWGTSGIICNGTVINYMIPGGPRLMLEGMRRIGAIP